MKSPFFSHAKNIIWTIIFWSLVLFPLYKDKIFPKLISALTQNDSINGRPLHIKQTKNDVGDQELQNERYQNEYFSYKVYSSLQSEVTGYTYGKDVLRGRNIKITNGLPVVIRSKYLNKMNPLEKTLRINYTVYHQPIKSDVNYIVEFGIYQFRNYKGKEMYKVIASDKYPINISHEYSVDAYKRYGKIQVSGTILDIFPSELERGYYGAYWKYYYPNGEELQIFTSPNKPAIEPVKKQSKWLFILD